MLREETKVRRTFAKVAFLSILLTLVSVLGIVFFGGTSVAANLNAASGIVISILTCLTGIVGQYAHIVYSEDKHRRELSDSTDDT